jgi:hypothetical protein
MHRGVRLLMSGFGFIGLVQAQADWRFAHPKADMRMSVNLQAVLKSPAVAEALKKAGTGPKDQAMQIQLALGLLSTVDRISISARQGATGSLTGKDSDVLVLVTGSFDPQMIQSFFPSKGTSQVKQVGPHAVLIGEGPSFAQAVQRMAGEMTSRPADELEQSDIWIAGSSALMSQPATTPSNIPPAFKAMRAFSLGVNLGDSPEANVVLSAADAGSAAQMLTAFRAMLAPLTQAPQAAMLEQALQMKQDGSKVRIHFLPPPEVMRFAQAQAASVSYAEQLQPLLGMMGMTPGPKKDPPQPANGGKIMIYGLDDGPHEVKTK